jgi:hypothetical protein
MGKYASHDDDDDDNAIQQQLHSPITVLMMQF